MPNKEQKLNDEKILFEVTKRMMNMNILHGVLLRLEEIQALQRLSLEAIHNRRK